MHFIFGNNNIFPLFTFPLFAWTLCSEWILQRNSLFDWILRRNLNSRMVMNNISFNRNSFKLPLQNESHFVSQGKKVEPNQWPEIISCMISDSLQKFSCKQQTETSIRPKLIWLSCEVSLVNFIPNWNFLKYRTIHVTTLQSTQAIFWGFVSYGRNIFGFQKIQF